MPLAAGWYAHVQESLHPKNSQSECQKLDVNCFPRSQVMIEGQPKLATQYKRNALTMVSVSMLQRGIAWHQRVNLSTIVKA